MSETLPTHPSTNSVLASLGFLDDGDEPFEPKVVTAEVVSASADVARLLTRPVDGSVSDELIVPVTEWVPSRPLHRGDVVQALQLEAGPRALASLVRDELIEALFAGVSPEVRSGEVRIMGVARVPGLRCKVAVAATETPAGHPVVDAIAACLGRAANRVAYVREQLAGEQIDIVAWHPEPERYLENALAPAKITSVTITDGQAVATAPEHQMSAAVGGHGLNSKLAGQLVGVSVTIERDA